jgi:nitrite reductase/ring-hydroxylating ferredoxin subunit
VEEEVEAPREVTPPEGFEVVLHTSALQDGEIVEVIVAGTALAIARVHGEFFATSNACTHAGGPIGDGTLDEYQVQCPYHGWTFDVRDGACAVDADEPLDSYRVVVVGDAVCVAV